MSQIILSSHIRFKLEALVDRFVTEAAWKFLCSKGEVKTIQAFYHSSDNIVSHPSILTIH